MRSLVETEQVTIYVGLDQALFVFPSAHWCPQCGRPSRVFRYINGHSECLGCSGSEPGSELELNVVELLVLRRE